MLAFDVLFVLMPMYVTISSFKFLYFLGTTAILLEILLFCPKLYLVGSANAEAMGSWQSSFEKLL